MSPNATLAELRDDFRRAGNRFLAMPIAGAVMWLASGVCGLILPALPDGRPDIALAICCALITPLAFLFARFLDENLVGVGNDLGRLMGRSMLLTNLFWAVAVPFWWIEPSSLPLTAGIILGLQWIVLGWIIQHWIGLVHAVLRTLLVVTVWCLLPEHRFVAVPAVIVGLYAFAIVVLANRVTARDTVEAIRVARP